MYKRGAKVLALLAVVASALVSASAYSKNVVITFGHSKGPDEQKIFQRLITEFEKQNPGIKVKVELYSGGFREKLLMQFVAGKAPDVFETGLEDFPLYPSGGYLYPLDKFMGKAGKDDFPKQLLKTFSNKGQLYALTRDVAPMVLAYNKKMFAEVGVSPPDASWDWTSYVTTLKKFAVDTNGDRKMDRWGYGGGNWEGFVWQNGGDIYNDEVKPTRLMLGSPEALDGLQFVADLANKWQVMPRGGATWTDTGSFSAGKAATTLVGYWMKINDLKTTKVPWDVAPVPKGKERVTIMMTAAWSMNRVSKHPMEAFKWLAFVCGEWGQREMAKLGLAVPSRRSIAKEVIPNSPPPANGQAFLDAVDYGRLVYHKGFRNATEAINSNLADLWNGKVTAQQAVTKMEPAVRAWIARIK